MAAGKSLDDYRQMRWLELSLTRLVEIIGEAAFKVSDEAKAAHPSIPWKSIVNMRHKLIHGYDRVDLDVLYRTIRDDLPPLIDALNEAINS